MPAEIVTMQDCASNFGIYEVVGSRGSTYVVELGGESFATCTCLGFKYSKNQTCKHLDQVYREACLYNPQCHDAKENPGIRPVRYSCEQFSGATCECGGPMVYVKRAI
jgi:hypothetical protein